MKTYRKKPVVIEAVQWNKNIDEMKSFMGVIVVQADKLLIGTLEGTMTANIGDFIIKGVNGEFYPCKPDIFEKTYEQFSTPSQGSGAIDKPDDIPQWILDYDKAEHQSSAGKAIRILLQQLVEAKEAFKNGCDVYQNDVSEYRKYTEELQAELKKKDEEIERLRHQKNFLLEIADPVSENDIKEFKRIQEKRL